MSRTEMVRIICDQHYTRSIPSGKSIYFNYNDAIVVFAIPANHNISKFLVGQPNKVWELARLYAPDGHQRNLLTQALAATVRMFREQQPNITALVSYADPNVGHLGGVYRSASWVYLGQSEESRNYRAKDGTIVSRRKFHSGQQGLRKIEIEALGYEQLKLPGKHRFVKGLTKRTRRLIAMRERSIT